MARKPKVVEEVERTSTCKNCRWAEFGKEAIKCHRDPPQPVVDLSDGGIIFVLPLVSVEDWCSGFAPYLNS